VSIQIVAEYVFMVYDTSILIYSHTDGREKLLQEIEPGSLNEIGSQNKFKYTRCAVNPIGDNSEIVLLAQNEKTGTKTTQTTMIVLREKDAQEQIKELVGKGKIQEAHDIFVRRTAAKNTENFSRIKKEFDLNAGWQMLNLGHPEKMLSFFKNSDVDPRELIILFDDLQKDLRPALSLHIEVNHISKMRGLHQTYSSYQLNYPYSNEEFDAQSKLLKAKEQLRNLFQHLNQRYLKELRKDEEKVAEFMYSIYCVQQAIKREPAPLLKEIVPFVQTALIRLYIEDDVEGSKKIQEFFN